jgi:hypothetical protein
MQQRTAVIPATTRPWRFSVDIMSVNYQNTNYAYDVFETLRPFSNLRYLNIAVGSHVGSPYCESICSEDAKGFWALRNLRRVKLTFSGSRYGIKQNSTVEVYSVPPITSPPSSRPVRVGLILGPVFCCRCASTHKRVTWGISTLRP